jgi:glucose/mannose transport system substrate-binding protein
MFKGKGSTAPQMTLASDIESPEFQVAFNTVKGSVPARTDVSGEKFDACGQKGIKDLAEAAASNHLLGSMAHGYAQPASIKNAMYDVITAHFNGEYDSATAVKELVSAVEDAK